MLITLSCKPDPAPVHQVRYDTTRLLPTDTIHNAIAKDLVTKDSVTPEQIIAFAKTLLGTPYKYGCSAPDTGFDCSGFISYVFNHFNIDVPRSSVDFTNAGEDISLTNSKPGDLILFTGTDSKVRTVGHIGLIVTNDSSGISFIHSSSGSDYAVIITPLNERYMERYVKVIRIRK